MTILEICSELQALVVAKGAGEILWAPPATSVEIEALENGLGLAIPEQLSSYLRAHNGQSDDSRLFDGNFFMGSARIAREWKVHVDLCGIYDVSLPEGYVRPGPYRAAWIPILRGDNNVIFLDDDPDEHGSRGQIVNVYFDDDRAEVLAPDLVGYLVQWRDAISRGEAIYVANAGGFYPP